MLWSSDTHAVPIGRSQTEGEDGKCIVEESVEDGQERSDCTVCTDEQPDFDAEVSQDGRGSSGNRGLDNEGDRFAMVYVKDGEMERMLEKQAELIGQYEAEESAQREWEKKFSKSQDSTAVGIVLFLYTCAFYLVVLAFDWIKK